MELYILLLNIFFGFLPSLLWLSYYLQKDMHPEPKKMIIKTFFGGVIVTIPTLFVQVPLFEGLIWLQKTYQISYLVPVFNIVRWFLVIALVEELAKYFAVNLTAFSSKEIDEPLDVMLYMVVTALGFAALENVLYIFSPIDGLPFSVILEKTIMVSFIRFVGATFLHTLCSALLGYYLVMSFQRLKNRMWLTIMGIVMATFLHGLYDYSIIVLRTPFNFIIPIAILTGLATFILSQFKKVKQLKGVCKLN